MKKILVTVVLGVSIVATAQSAAPPAQQPAYANSAGAGCSGTTGHTRCAGAGD